MNSLETDPRLEETQAGADMPDVRAIRFVGDLMLWDLADGRVASAPLTHWPTLWLATPEERETFQISHAFVHWPLLDADIMSEHILRGQREHPACARRAWEQWMERHYSSRPANKAA